MKRCAQGDLTGILDFYQLVINETEDMPVHARRLYESLGFQKRDVRHWYAENTGWVDFYLFEFLL